MRSWSIVPLAERAGAQHRGTGPQGMPVPKQRGELSNLDVQG
jgi:hypothetical protein